MTLDSYEQVLEMVKKHQSLTSIPKEKTDLFFHWMTRDRNTWFLEAGEASGLIYFTNVVPDLSAYVNAIFWDGHLNRVRIQTIRSACILAMERFNLQRVSMAQMVKNRSVITRMQEIAGFKQEGVIRKGWQDESGLFDLVLLGLLREECEAPRSA